ncbi:PLP-dependent aminotransferase family protein [Methylomonas sp. AM2-LC]|uniref:MocR-like pyridoxine biosynthesis transcription factor PdxR n=1 Tax=Methylomonas sp. AM2-LC TaxID=3153301 RepID=UPI0032652B9E
MLRIWDFDLNINRDSDIALHVQIVQSLIGEIRRGRLSNSTPIPGSRELAERLQVNRKTVVLAYEELVAQGWLETQGRRGTFVAAKLPVIHTAKSSTDDANNEFIAVKNSKPTLLSNTGSWDTLMQNGVIDLNDGIPDARIIPYTVLSRAYRHALLKTSRNNLLGYGDPRGVSALRKSLASMLNLKRGLAANENNICMVRGSQMGLYVAARVLVSPGDCVVFETLSYAPAQTAFQACGAKILTVEQDRGGLIVEHLESLCSKNPVKVVYVTPHHQYPTTVMMTAERRLRLLMLAEQFNFTIVEDDYDHEFHFDHSPTHPIASIDQHKRIVYIGSMSKILAPGLRVGYLVASQQLVDQCANIILQIDRQGNPVTEFAVNELMESGELHRHIRRALRTYAQRRNAAIESIRTFLGDYVEFDIPAGGLAFWLRLHKETDSKTLATMALQNGLRIVSSEQYSIITAKVAGIRVGYASLSDDVFKMGIKRLNEVLAQITM